MSLHFFGIRHHGPGCARQLMRNLEKLKPDVVLVEGPPEANDIIHHVVSDHMAPPVALMIYEKESLKNANYYPFTNFSPEWQVLLYANRNQIPFHFIDLPQSIMLSKNFEKNDDDLYVTNPFILLAQAAGYEDYELWWDYEIESRYDSQDLFPAIDKLMHIVRKDIETSHQEKCREAYMRQMIRNVQVTDKSKKIAIICGAWHIPAVKKLDTKLDDEILQGLTNIDVCATWIPWTNSRLSYRSGYGAGIYSPGWYQHLWNYGKEASIHWIIKAAQLFRQKGISASSACVIETVRLATTLAAIRNLVSPGLKELSQAIQTTLCEGEENTLKIIQDKLEINEVMGNVPNEVPKVPLRQNIENFQQKFKLVQSTEEITLDLDLRKNEDRKCSLFLHRLQLLGIQWGTKTEIENQKGTFKERWNLIWLPSFHLKIIEMSVWGNTVEKATESFISHSVKEQNNLQALIKTLQLVILSDLPQALAKLIEQIQKISAVASDIKDLIDSVPSLVFILRYGDVREIDTAQIEGIINTLVERIFIGVSPACTSLEENFARCMFKSLANFHQAMVIMDDKPKLDLWMTSLNVLQSNENIHFLIQGWSCSVLTKLDFIDQKIFDDIFKLIVAEDLLNISFWVEGLLFGDLLFSEKHNFILKALDMWVSDLAKEEFLVILPALRRAFSYFDLRNKAKLGQKITYLYHRKKQNVISHNKRGELVLPILSTILGVDLKSE
ncbi:DUF5682 family protein [Candidatus Uabimicrobium sp. HlEnr_7]|uniref:DUF5682 family protein n=1 Tax=Candidatus Uabimicrobium helgolandensis TaxID=3095367 RepID=UPI003556A347